jgi:hypothetical protein
VERSPSKKNFFIKKKFFFNLKLKSKKIKIMKLISGHFLDALSASEFENLTIQVEETLATNTGIIIHKKPRSIFTAAQLWNIHRQRKTSFSGQNFKSNRF